MLPGGLDADALFRTIADRAGDRAQLGSLQGDVHRDDTRFVTLRRGHFARLHRDGGDKSGGSDCAAQVELQTALVGIAGLEARDAGEVAARKECLVATDHVAEDILAIRSDGQRQVALDALVIDQQFGFVDFGEGIACLAKRAIEIETLVDDRIGLQVISGLNAECGAQFFGIGCRGQLSEIDGAIGIARTGDDIEAHPRALLRRIFARVARADRTDHLAIVISVDTQQRTQQLLVLARAGGKLGDVLVAIIQFLDRGQCLEPIDEIAALREWRLLLRKAEHQRIGDFLQIGFVERDPRCILEQVGEPDIIFGLERFERRNLDIFGPGHGNARNIADRGIGIGLRHLAFGCRTVGALLRPFIGVFYRAVGYQFIQRRRAADILRQNGMRCSDRRHREAGSQSAARHLTR